MLDLTQGQFVKHVVMHPFEGFEDLRWKKAGSMKIAIGIVCLLFIAGIQPQLCNFRASEYSCSTWSATGLCVPCSTAKAL